MGVNVTYQSIILQVWLWLGKLYLHNIQKLVRWVRKKHDPIISHKVYNHNFESSCVTGTFTHFLRNFKLLLMIVKQTRNDTDSLTVLNTIRHIINISHDSSIDINGHSSPLHVFSILTLPEFKE
jgi:hypothetical protein